MRILVYKKKLLYAMLRAEINMRGGSYTEPKADPGKSGTNDSFKVSEDESTVFTVSDEARMRDNGELKRKRYRHLSPLTANVTTSS